MRHGSSSVRHPGHWWIDFLFVWSIFTLVSAVTGLIAVIPRLVSWQERWRL